MQHPHIDDLAQHAEAGHIAPLRSATQDTVRSAEYIMQGANRAQRDLTHAESREVQDLLERAATLKRLTVRAEDRDAQRNAAAAANWRGGPTRSELDLVFRGLKHGTHSIPLWDYMLEQSVQLERRDLVKSTGSMIPTDIVRDIYLRIIQRSGVLSAGPRIINTDPSGATLKLNQVTAYSTAAIVAEGSAIAESDPVISAVSLEAHKYSFLLQYSNELRDDATVNFEQSLAPMLGNAISNAVAAHYATGSGTAQPEGIMTNATTGVTGGTALAGAPTVANIISLFGSLKSQYRATSSWVMNSATFTYLANLNDTQGRSLLLPSLVDGAMNMLMGRPLYLDDNIASFGTGVKSIWFGSMQDYFVVRNAGPVEITPSQDYALNQDLMTVRTKFRTDSKKVNDDAGRVFVGGAS